MTEKKKLRRQPEPLTRIEEKRYYKSLLKVRDNAEVFKRYIRLKKRTAALIPCEGSIAQKR